MEFLNNFKKKTCLIYRKNNSPRIFTFNEEIMNKKKFVQLDSIVLTIIYVRLIYKDFSSASTCLHRKIRCLRVVKLVYDV